MRRLTSPAPADYHRPNFAREVAEAWPDAIDTNEVEADDGTLLVAVYVDDDHPMTEADVGALIDAHDPTPPEPEPTIEDRLAEVEERLGNAPSAADIDELRQTLGGNR